MKPSLLVLELWGLGDLIIATPFLQAAAKRYSVTLLAKPYAAELRPRFWPEVEVIPFNVPWTAFHGKYHLWHWPWRRLSQLRRDLTARKFDYGVSARWDPRDHLALKLCGVRERLGFSRLNSSRYLTRELSRPSPLSHRYEFWRVAAAALGLMLPPRETLFVSKAHHFPVLVIHSGARLPLRVWPLEKFYAVAVRLRQIGVNVRILCDPDQETWWRAQGEHPHSPKTVAELMVAMDGAGAFFGNDSGPGHLAAACGLPTFTLFGPQLHEWFTPLHPASESIEGKACPYKPCSDYCRFDNPFCLTKLGMEDIWPQLSAFIFKHLLI